MELRKEMSGTKQTGTVKTLVAERGFGFIRPTGGTKDIFFHATGLVNRDDFDSLTEGQSVEYDIEQQPGNKGPRAIQITVVS